MSRKSLRKSLRAACGNHTVDSHSPCSLATRKKSAPRNAASIEPLENRVLLAADWTVMMYLNGDNDLETWATEALIKLEQVGSTANVNITVQLDRSPGSDASQGYDTGHGDWADTRRGLVARGTDPDNYATPLVSLGEKDMGNPDTLRDFVTWSATNYPATHYALFIKDHGGGLAGISFDDTPAADGKQHGISVAGVSTALTQAGVHPDIIVADACTMGMTEVAYQWRNNASILVASEPSILAHWYPYGVYDHAMADLAANPGQSPDTFAQDIVAHMADETTQAPTVAAIDLSKMNNLAAALDNFASQALALPDTWADISSAISQSNYYENLWYRDLGTFLDNVQAYVTDPSAGFLLSSALDARTALSSSLIALRSAPGEDATGLSIYLPNQGDRGDASYNGTNYSFLADTQWDEFLYQFDRRYVTQVSKGMGWGAVTDITSGWDGNLWFTQNGNGGIGRSTPGGVVTLFGFTDHGWLQAITKGPDGNVWFADSGTAAGKSRVGRVTPTGVITEYSIGLSALYDIATGPDGNLWVAGIGGIGRITPDGAVSVFSDPGAITGITAGPDGNLWFTGIEPYNGRGWQESGYDVVGSITPFGGVTYFHSGLGDNCMPMAITAGPDGNLWFTQGLASVWTHAGGIGRVTPSGVITTFYTGSYSNPMHITEGPDGNLWFTESNAGSIGKITTKGVVTEYPDPDLAYISPYGITTGPDNRVWFTAYNVGRIAHFNMPTQLAVKVESADGQSNPTNQSPINFTVTFTQPVFDFGAGDVMLDGTAPGTLTCTITNPSGDNTIYNVAVSGMTGNGAVGVWIPKGVAHSFNGDPNTGSPDDVPMVMYDVAPFTVTVNQAESQVDPTSTPQVDFTIVFNKPAPYFQDYEVALSGTAPGTLTRSLTNPTGDNRTFNLSVTGMTAYGTVRATIPAGWETDAAGNRSQASTSTDNVVTYQPFAAPPPMVTIDQAAGQPDPTTTASINFTAVFTSEVTDFSASSVTVSGTAPGAHVASVVDSGDHKTYTITVSGVSGSGTVIASIGIGQAHDVWGQGNFAATSHDNTVTYAVAGAPTVTVTPSAGAPNPTGLAAFFTIVFNRPVTDFVASDVVLGGTAPGTKTWYIVSSTGQMTYNIRVTGMTGSGTVTATVPAGVTHASTGEANLASVNSGNVVTFEYMRVTEYATPTHSAAPYDMVTGPDGNLWFTEYYANKIAKMTPGGTITEYAAGTTYPDQICVGQDGNLWFTSWGQAITIGKITTSGAVTLYRNITPSTSEYVEGITAGPDGNLWFAAEDYVGKITTSGSVTRYSIGNGTVAKGITTGPDGNVWFTSEFGNKIGRITPSGTLTWFSSGITTGNWLIDIVPGQDGNLWFTEAAPGSRGAIGRITPDGVVTEFTTGLSASSSPWGITATPDGKLWYTGSYLVGRITSAGVVTEYAIPGFGLGIAQGPDGNIWFADESTYKVGRLSATQELPVTIEESATQSDPTSDQPIHYTVVFRRAVTDFTADKLRFGGTAAGIPSGVITDSGDHMTFDVAVSGLTGSGTLVLSLASGSVHDANGNASQNATSTDNIVDYQPPDVTPPSVTINQAADQMDPTDILPIHFQAFFSEPVTDFDFSDIHLGGSAVGASAVVIDSGDHMTYDIWVDGVALDAWVMPSIPAGAVHDAAGNANLASTSSDNVVTYSHKTDSDFSIADPNLEAAIRQQLINDGYTPGDVLTPTDMGLLTDLDAYGAGITNLSGLEYANHLQTLNLNGYNRFGNAGLAIIGQLSGLQGLYINDTGITTLAPIAGLTSLTGLDIGNNSITDAAALAGFTRLTYLYATNSGPALADTRVLSSLTGLEDLYLEGVGVTDITPLTGLTGLRYIELGSNNFHDLSPLANKPLLATISIADGLLTNADLATLDFAMLPSLDSVSFAYNNITSLAFVMGIPSLHSLGMAHNEISDLTPLASCPALGWLDLTHNQIQDLSPLSRLTTLYSLNLDANLIQSLAPLEGLGDIQNLSVAHNALSSMSGTDWSTLFTDMVSHNWNLDIRGNMLDISEGSADRAAIDEMVARGVNVQFDPQQNSGVVHFGDAVLEQAVRDALGIPTGDLTRADMLNLLSLDSSYAGITNLQGLEFATNLQTLNLSGNPIGDAGLAVIAQLKMLNDLSISDCGITSLAALAPTDPANAATGMPNLASLDVGGNGSLADYWAVRTMLSLQSLTIGSCGISDTAPLNGLTNLTYLYVSFNSLTSLSDISTLTNLQTLYGSYNSITDISAIAGCTALRSLNLDHNQVSDLSPIQGMAGLQVLYIDNNLIHTITNVDWSRLPQLVWGNICGNYVNVWPESADGVAARALFNRANGFGFQSQHVTFADANFESAIRTALGRPTWMFPSILSNEMNDALRLNSLDLSGMPITSIQGIENAEKLTFLDLRNTGMNLAPGSADRARVDVLISRGVSVLFNTVPVVHFGSVTNLNEGATFTGSGSFVDPDTDVWTATVDYGDGSGVQSLTLDADKSFALSHRYDEVGDYTVIVIVNDGTATGWASFGLEVDPVAPTATLTDNGPVSQGQPVTVFFSDQYDPSNADMAAGFRYSYFFTGTPDSPAAGDIIDSTSAQATFTFILPGTHTVIARITDQHGAYSQYSTDVNVLQVAPTITNVTGAADGWYRAGQNLDFTVSFSENVMVSGTPTIRLTIGLSSRSASYLSGSGSSSLIFRYTVQAGDNDGDGIASASPVALNGGTIQDAAGNGATLTFIPPITTGVLVDTIAPALSVLSINDGAAQRSMVKKLALSFGEKVVLGTGAVTLTMSDGSDVPDTTLLVSNPSGDQKNYVLSFSGIGVVGGSLADGIYDLSVAAAGVQDLAGNALSGSFSQRFHRLYGDYDGNKTVNNADYFWFKQTFNKSRGETGFLDLYDYDGNGTINNGDYFQFKKRFGVIYSY